MLCGVAWDWRYGYHVFFGFNGSNGGKATAREMDAIPTFGRKWGNIMVQSPTLMAENVGIMGKSPHFLVEQVWFQKSLYL